MAMKALSVTTLFLALLATLISTLLFNALTLKSLQLNQHLPRNAELDIRLSAKDAAKDLAEAITYKTISYEDRPLMNYTTFEKFHQFLETKFPKLHRRLTKEVVIILYINISKTRREYNTISSPMCYLFRIRSGEKRS